MSSSPLRPVRRAPGSHVSRRALIAPPGKSGRANVPNHARGGGTEGRSRGHVAAAEPSVDRRLLAVVSVVLAVLGAWAYWPTLVDLVKAWDRDPDYSHGYLVVPLSLFFLWLRRDRLQGAPVQPTWSGLVLVGLGGGLYVAGGLIYLDALVAYSMIFWIAGAVLLVGGWRVLAWSLPSIAFLVFMVPLPFRVEHMLSGPLQLVATSISCWILQFLGQPALAEGTTILLGPHQLEVEQACSGLRIFVGIIALACAYLIAFQRAWWERLILILAIIPIALLANAVRIVITALLYMHVSGDAAREFSHDAAGWVGIPLAALMFGFVLWFLGRLMREEPVVEVRDLLRAERP